MDLFNGHAGVMKTIFLHIGQTKTATTTLQAFFFVNRNWLANKGVLYPRVPEKNPFKRWHCSICMGDMSYLTTGLLPGNMMNIKAWMRWIWRK